MSDDQYDRLLAQIRRARAEAAAHRIQADEWDKRLDRLLVRLDREESRIARSALSQSHSASRKLVVGE